MKPPSGPISSAPTARRALTSLLFGVSAADPRTFDLAAVILAGVAFAACSIQARRAIGVEPAAVLRDE